MWNERHNSLLLKFTHPHAVDQSDSSSTRTERTYVKKDTQVTTRTRRTMAASSDVLIIGAGPTGLMLACQLSLYPNISVRIIDKNASRTTQSRALVVHARSLEILSQLNLIDKAIARGAFVDAMNFYFNGKHALRLDYATIRNEPDAFLSKYPYLLFLEQSITEELLETFLNEHNVFVERNTEAVELTSIDDAHVQVKLTTGETVRTKYICGCDGAHSIVRRQLQLTFSGQTYSDSIFIADCHLQNLPVPTNEVGLFFSETGFAGSFPLVNNRHRLTGSIQDRSPTDPPLTLDEVVSIFKQRSQLPDVSVSDCQWISLYRSHHRHVSKFRCRKQYFLLGDAAHIHSPLGGQGMNTGLQDAYNLAWKLAHVLVHQGKDELLDTYHDERYRVAETLVQTTDRGFALVSSPKPWVRFLRMWIIPYILQWIVQPILNHFQSVRHAAFVKVSQLGISYRLSNSNNSLASDGGFHRSIPMPGDRFPYMIFEPCFYHFVLFEDSKLVNVDKFCEFLLQNHGKTIKVHYAQKESMPLRYPGAFLVRPDGYIGYRTVNFDIDHFRSHFSQYFSSA